MFRRITNILLIFLSCCLLLSACQSEQESLPTIRLGYAPHDHHAALYIAAQLPDYFRQQGGVYLKEIVYKERYQLIEDDQPVANIELQSSAGGGQLIRKLHEKQLDVALGGVPAMIKQIDAGSKMKIVAPLMSEGAALVMGKDCTSTDWQSFIAMIKISPRPVRIGYKIETSVQNLIFEKALKSEGIRFSREEASNDAKVIVFNLHGAKNLIPALKNDLIDGFVVMQPFVALAEYQQVGKTVANLCDLPPDRQWADHPCCALAAGDRMLDFQRDVLVKLTSLLLSANRYLQQNQQQGAELVANWLGRPLEVEQLSLPTINYLVDYPANWDSGVEFWIGAMEQQQLLDGAVRAAKKQDRVKDLLYDNSVYLKARKQMVPE